MSGDHDRGPEAVLPSTDRRFRPDRGVPSTPGRPGAERASAAFAHNVHVIKGCLVLLCVLGLIHTLYFARAVLLPMTMAFVLNLVLKPLTKRLHRLGLPGMFSAVAVFGVFTVVIAVGLDLIWEPANHWLAQAPASLHKVREKLRSSAGPFVALKDAEQEIESLAALTGERVAENQPISVRVEQPGLTNLLLNTTGSFAGAVAITLSLLFFLMAAGDRFLEKFVHLRKSGREKQQVVALVETIERQLSTYLGTITLINIGLGTAIGLGLWVIGMPHPMLWGVAAALLNYIPFAGLVIGSSVVFIIAAAEFNTLAHAALAPMIYLAANGIEANLVTPTVLGKSISLNPVVILIMVFLGGWCWGIGGIFLAVPLLLILKIISDSHESMRALGVFLGR